MKKEIEEYSVDAVPVEIFSHETGPLESLVKFLKENSGMRYSEIARLLNRNPRTIWSSYHSALKKEKSRFEDKGSYYVELKEFSKGHSVLETVVAHLIAEGLSITEAAKLLNKHRNTIWTAYSRYKNGK